MKTGIPSNNTLVNQTPIDLSQYINWSGEINRVILNAVYYYAAASDDKPIVYMTDHDYSHYVSFPFQGKFKAGDFINVLVPNFKIDYTAISVQGGRQTDYVITAHIVVNALQYNSTHQYMGLSFLVNFYISTQYDNPSYRTGELGVSFGYKFNVNRLTQVSQRHETIQLSTIIPYSNERTDNSKSVTASDTTKTPWYSILRLFRLRRNKKERDI